MSLPKTLWEVWSFRVIMSESGVGRKETVRGTGETVGRGVVCGSWECPSPFLKVELLPGGNAMIFFKRKEIWTFI